jgi:hypothetical protein
MSESIVWTPLKGPFAHRRGCDPYPTPALRRTVGALLRDYVHSLGVHAFNVAFYMPPLSPTDEDWSEFPTVVHLVDRGSPANRTSDIGAMELYAASVVASDPFRVAEALRNSLTG